MKRHRGYAREVYECKDFFYEMLTGQSFSCQVTHWVDKEKIASVILSTRVEDLITMRWKLLESLRESVKEMTLDMPMRMVKVAQWAFHMAALVTDRFHVERLSIDAVQQASIDQRWKEIYREA